VDRVDHVGHGRLGLVEGALMTSTSLHQLKSAALSDPRGKSIVVVGGGKTGAAAARLLLAHGAHVCVMDDADVDQVRAALSKHGVTEAEMQAMGIVGGGLQPIDVGSTALVVLSPGVPRSHHVVAAALPHVPCANDVELAYALLPSEARAQLRVWAITGTNGKSTTTTMAGAIATVADAHAFVGGNLGTPMCARVLAGAPWPRIAVLELSSYQLETISHLPVHAAAITNLTPDHLDRYASVESYYQAKASLLTAVVNGGGVVLNHLDTESKRHLQAPPQARIWWLGRDLQVTQDDALRIEAVGHQASLVNPHVVGLHNQHNAACAAALAWLDGCNDDVVVTGLRAYAGIAHRLERLGEQQGLTWWNDSKATNVDAAVTAVASFRGGVHLIAGGLGKGSSYAPLVQASRGVVVRVYTIGADAEVIAAAFAGVVDVEACGTLEHAAKRVRARAVAGEHLLLSPACASFDQFRDYGHRGDVLRALFARADQLEST
jgi:UDP-N-acetylmuramoylalanine--D-glutamate ligase